MTMKVIFYLISLAGYALVMKGVVMRNGDELTSIIRRTGWIMTGSALVVLSCVLQVIYKYPDGDYTIASVIGVLFTMVLIANALIRRKARTMQNEARYAELLRKDRREAGYDD